MKFNSWFIGANDVTFEGTWRWLETGLGVQFTKWGTGQPDGNNSKNCLALEWEGSDLVWKDENCGSTTTGHNGGHHGHHTHGARNFICEKP